MTFRPPRIDGALANEAAVLAFGKSLRLSVILAHKVKSWQLSVCVNYA